MKRLLVLLFPAIVFANPIDNNCPQFTVYGAPVSNRTPTQYICKQNYAINYRYDTKTPEYVVEHLTINNINGYAKRKDDFRPDPIIPKKYQSTLADYNGKGYDRGHLAPAGDNTTNDSIMSESFYLSNMIPQVPSNNRGIWDQLETNIRNYVKDNLDIYVVSGTYYQPGYKTIGNKVGVPSFIWKVIYNKTNNKAIAYLIPNTDVDTKDLQKFIISISDLENLTGINFLPLLPNSDKIESITGSIKDWPVN